VARSQVLQFEGAARELRIEDRVAKSVGREISIGRENYETTITLISSDISRFSRSTVLLAHFTPAYDGSSKYFEGPVDFSK
jgi:hypothetical protein